MNQGTGIPYLFICFFHNDGLRVAGPQVVVKRRPASHSCVLDVGSVLHLLHVCIAILTAPICSCHLILEFDADSIFDELN
jgi:hypothetical protein